jgi:hypothetical protein
VYSFEKEGKQQLMQVRIHVDGARATNKFVHAEVESSQGGQVRIHVNVLDMRLSIVLRDRLGQCLVGLKRE